MILSEYSIQELAPLITGDKLLPYRSGPVLVKLFNKFGCRDVYNKGLPIIDKKSQQHASRTQYVENRLQLLSGKNELRYLLNLILLEATNPVDMAATMNEIINGDSFSVVQNNGIFQVEGGVIDNRQPVRNEAHFLHIQNQILTALDTAQVSINIAMAWFTNEVLRDKLIEKQKEGVEIHIAIYDDGINKKHGVNLSGITHTLVKGSRSGLMHNKFCIIDNQIVITGSYNWSTNAETRNDENVLVAHDPKEATKYSIAFRNLLKQKTSQS